MERKETVSETEAEEKPLQMEEEMSSESDDSDLEWEWKPKPGEVLEMQESSDDEEEAVAERCNNGEAAQLLDDDIRVLFEAPSVFAIFRYDGFKLGQPNALEEIWADFVDPELAKEEVSLLHVQTFKNKAHTISQSTGVSEEFAMMIKNNLKPGQKLAVGNEDYKSIIENKLNIPCMFDSTVADLMWGLKIQMQSLLPSENSDLINEDCFPMSKGMYYFLNGHKFDVKPDMMVTRDIIELAGLMYDCDCRVDRRRNTLRSVAEYIKRISGINTQDWDALKIATALKIICCPEENITAPQWMFSTQQMEKFKSDAPWYNMFLKAASLSLYDEVHYACKLRSKAGQKLTRLIKLAKKVDVEQPREAAIDQDDLDGKNILS